MGQVSGKGGGYYGCLGARSSLHNKLLVPTSAPRESHPLPRSRSESSIAQAMRYVLDGRAGGEIAHLHAHLPEQVKLKRAALATEERRVANFIDFIGERQRHTGAGRGPRAGGAQPTALRDELAL